MKILHVSNTDLAGGRFTGYYMQEALDDSFRVDMAVWKKTTQNPRVHQLPPDDRTLRALADTVARFTDRLGFDGILGSSGIGLPACDYFREADVVHLHLLHARANLSVLSLPELSRLKPLVWTLHDPWAITGGCEHSFECDRWLTGCAVRCPHPRRRSLGQHYSPAVHWRIKQSVYKRADMTLVVASQWMQEKVERSPLLRHLPCHRIAFGVDLKQFVPRSKSECKAKLGIPPGHRVIAFRGSRLASDRFKGMRWLLEALRMYEPPEPTWLLIVADGADFAPLSPRYQLMNPGWIDGSDLATALSAADVFLMPSIQESFGLMAAESMACGTPVVVCEGTALPEVIRAPLGGLAIAPMDSAALAGAIKLLLDDDALRTKLAAQGREIAEREYDVSLYVDRHIRVYEQAISRHSARARD